MFVEAVLPVPVPTVLHTKTGTGVMAQLGPQNVLHQSPFPQVSSKPDSSYFRYPVSSFSTFENGNS
jgi:hypothetical protein